MKPDFALILSADGIGLLQRGKGDGWLRVGDVPMSETGLDLALTELRRFAETLGPTPIRTKLVLPNDHIRYLALPDPGAAEPDVAAILDGQTPYDISELVIDWAREGETLYVAAVARETLEEAESFAVSHKFGPVSFVANAGGATFPREVWFGTSRAALRLLDAGEEVERDLAPIRVSGVAEAPTDAPDTVPDPAPDTKPRPTAAPQPKTAPTPAAPTKAAPEPAPEAPKAPRIAPDAPLSDLTASGPVSFASRRTDEPTPRQMPTPDPELAKSLNPRPSAPAEPSSGTPASGSSDGFFSRRAPAPQPPKAPSAAEAPSVVPAPPDGTAKAAKATPPKPTAKAQKAEKAAAKVASPAAQPQPKPAPKPLAATAKDAPEKAKAKDTDVSAEPALAARRAPQPDPSASPATKPARAGQDERLKMTVFGARDAPVIGGKPRYLGLILTVALLLFLAAVAAYASIFLKDGLASLWRGDSASTVAEAPTRPVIGTEANQAEEAADLAALETGRSISERPATPSLTEARTAEGTQTAPALLSAPLSPEEAQTRYAATGIWQSAPNEPEQPATRGLDRLTLAGTDDPIPEIAALTRPASRPAQPDPAPAGIAPPPLPGQRFDLDARGLVRPTPEGALSPDGHLVIEGRPSPLPPQRPVKDTATDTDQDANAGAPEATDTDTAEAVLAPAPRIGPRPRLRPEAIATAAPAPTDTTVPDADTDTELAALAQTPRIGPRPRLRPASISATTAETPSDETLPVPTIQIAEIARPRQRPAEVATRAASRAAIAGPTVEAAAINAAVEAAAAVQLASVEPSPLPRTRPRNFSRVVKRAAVAPQAAAAVASPRRETIVPRIPSAASVTRQATVKNAINLRRVNLIGVYGKPSKRRALVRLSNGRFEKVKVGDRLDGGRVSAISESRLNYTKGGRTVTLSMPRG